MQFLFSLHGLEQGRLEKARTLYKKAAAMAVDGSSRSLADENIRKVDRLLSQRHTAK